LSILAQPLWQTAALTRAPPECVLPARVDAPDGDLCVALIGELLGTLLR
jgi:hypothetical protein